MLISAQAISRFGLILVLFGGFAAQHPAYGENRLDEKELYNQLTLFGDVLEQVRRNYVDAPSDKELIEAALSGMMRSLDPHSSYMPPQNFRGYAGRDQRRIWRAGY